MSFFPFAACVPVAGQRDTASLHLFSANILVAGQQDPTFQHLFAASLYFPQLLGIQLWPQTPALGLAPGIGDTLLENN